MCGICGVVQIGGEPRDVVAPEVLDRMTDVMTHRGPNDRGTYQAPGVALGVRRLSIVDVADGHQPFTSESGRVVAVQNGELYNHDDVRAELAAAGHVLRTRCDTEILPHLYEQHGRSYQERLRGKFAIAVWDADRRRAVISRDRLGVKPLYWARAGDVVVFASELKSLLASGLVRADLDYEAIDAYLTFGFVPGPKTPIAGVSKLPPGHRLVLNDSGVTSEAYWEYPRPTPGADGTTRSEYAERLLHELEESVRLRLMSDVPLGAMLSGGLDSSLIVGLMARNMSRPVKTFSVGFAESGKDNELADARFVADVFGTDHHELELSYAHDTVPLDELTWHLDEPLAELSTLGFLALSELTAEHVTVALSGQGADELLGGYRKHQAAALVASWGRLPGPARATGELLARHSPGRYGRAARTLLARDPADRLLAMSSQFADDLRAPLLRGPLAELDGAAARRAVLARLDGLPDSPLASTLFVDGQLALVDLMLHYFDRASMAHSLEVRVPFLDHHVVEFCATIPDRLKVRGFETKHLLKYAARGIVPKRIIEKRKIGFFRNAVDDWFSGQAGAAIDAFLLAPEPSYADFLDRGEVARLVAAHRDGSDTRHGRLLLAVLMLEVWLSTYVPRALGAAEPVRERVIVPA